MSKFFIMDPKTKDILEYVDTQIARIEEELEHTRETMGESTCRELSLFARQNGLRSVAIYIYENHSV